MSRGRSISPSAAYLWGTCFWLLLLGIDIFASGGLLRSLLPGWDYPLLRQHSLSGGLLAGLIYIVITSVVTHRLSDAYIILSKLGASYATTLLACGLVSTRLSLDWGGLLEYVLIMLSLGHLYASYQAEERATTHLKLGIYLAALLLYDIRLVCLLPLWVYAAYSLHCLSLRGVLSLLTGLGATLSLVATYALYRYGIEGTETLYQVWLQPLGVVEPLVGNILEYIDLFVLCILALISAVSYSWGANRESVRQRRQGSVQVAWVLLGVVALQFYPTDSLALLTLIPTALLGARALLLLEGRAYKIVLSLLGILFVALTLIV